MLEPLRILSSQTRFDLIIFTGDMIDRGGEKFKSLKEAYSKFDEIVISRLCDALNLDKTYFICVPGNHEVNRKAVEKKYDVELEQSLITSDKIREHLLSANDNKGFGERLKDYDNYYRQPWLNRIQSKHIPYTNTVKLADHIILNVDGREIGIAMLNSAWRCGIKIKSGTAKFQNTVNQLLAKLKIKKRTRKEENRTLIGQRQISDALSFYRDRDVDYIFGCAHHHFSLLDPNDASDIENALRAYYDVCFFGHMHEPFSNKTEKHEGELISMTAPGALVENEGVISHYTNGFSVFDIDFAQGEIKESKWMQQSGLPDFKLDRSLGKGTGEYTWSLRKDEYLMPVEAFLNDNREQFELDFSSEELNNLKNQIVRDPGDSKILFGLSGIGKTHLLVHAFGENSAKSIYSKIAYIKDSSKLTNNFIDQLEKFFIKNKDSKCCLILDNSNVDSFNKIKDLRDKRGSVCSLIGVINNLNHNDRLFSGVPIIELSSDMMRKAVDSYVDKEITDSTIRNIIKRYADGFPSIARRLVEKAKSNVVFDISDVHSMLSGLYNILKNEISDDEEVIEMLRVMSLFQPFPKLADDSMAIWKLTSLSSLSVKSRSEIVKLLDKVCKIWNGQLVENSPSGYSIRPFPLAVMMANQWFETHRDDEAFTHLLEDISNVDPGIQNTVVECMSRRLSEMNTSKAARELVGLLSSPGMVFRSENIVLSKLGSQLILAVSDVNPGLVSESIAEVLSLQSKDSLLKIDYFARRNLVTALSHLIKYTESFENAMLSLALLADSETEDNLANNASGVFEAVFHVYLPGTSVSLVKRVEWLRFCSDNPKISHLLHIALKGAFAFGMFSQVRGADEIINDYNPSPEEIKEYWEACTELAIMDIKNGTDIDVYAAIVNNHIHQWNKFKLVPWMMTLIRFVAEHDQHSFKMLEYDFDELYDDLKKTDALSAHILGDLKPKIVPSDFLSRLKSKQQDFYYNHFNTDTKEEDLFKDLTDEFLANNIYEDPIELSEIILSNDFTCWPFCINISEKISDTQLDSLYACIADSPVMTDKLVSPFLLTLCSMTCNREATNQFINSLYGKSFFRLYVRLMARTEDDKLSNLHQIESKFAGQNFEFIPVYLEGVSLTHKNEELLLHYLAEHFNCNQDAIMYFVATHYIYSSSKDDYYNPLIQIVSDYKVTEKSSYLIRDFTRFALSLLKVKENPELAQLLNEKFLSMPYDVFDEYSFNSIYSELLDKYSDILLESMLLRMADTEWFSVLNRLIDSLGTGMGFGAGVLFDRSDTTLNDILNRHGLPIARVYAKMCPIFGKGDEFSEWVKLLLEKYGDDKVVRENIHYNMSCFAWTGSVIPLYKRKINAFSKLLTHSNKTVREWAKINMKWLKEELLREEINEDFRYQIYR